MGVNHSSVCTAVPKQSLDVSNVGNTFKQMGCKTVSQSMNRFQIEIFGRKNFYNSQQRLNLDFDVHMPQNKKSFPPTIPVNPFDIHEFGSQVLRVGNF